MEQIIDIGNISDEENVFKLNSDDLSIGSLDSNIGTTSGVELFMNEKIKDGKKTHETSDLGDISAIDLAKPKYEEIHLPKNVNMSEDDIHVGKDTASDIFNMKPTWDGYQKFNEIPMNANIKPTSDGNKYEIIKEKKRYIKLLKDLKKNGEDVSTDFSVESSLDDIKSEYESAVEDKSKSNSIKFQGNLMLTIIHGIEYFNQSLNPFDIDIDGWHEKCKEDLDSYEEIFGELHEKYKSKASLAPELRLLFQLAGSASMVYVTNRAIKSIMPNTDDILQQHPELAAQISKAAVDSMSQKNPNMSNFMNNFIPSQPQKTNVYREPPNRPDLKTAMGDNSNTGYNINNNHGQTKNFEKSTKRPEMRGPPDVSDILSNIKTKTIDVPTHETKDSSISNLSIKELKEMQQTNVPRTKKRSDSKKNTISLDV